MKEENDNSPKQDRELEFLVSRFVDLTLSPKDALRLEQRLRENPEALNYCAEMVSLDAGLQDVLAPKELAWEEIRRVVIRSDTDPNGWSMQRHQTIRYGSRQPDGEPSPPRKSSRPWWIIAVVAVLSGSGITAAWLHHQSRAFHLRNGDFEAMDLSPVQSGFSYSILYWQDNFSSGAARLCDIAKVSHGNIYAKSGHNVVMLGDRAFLNQLIVNRNGDVLKASPGQEVTLRGWYHSGSTAPAALRCSLRFVASGYPEMIQYEAANATVSVTPGSWRAFEIRLQVPQDLVKPPSDTNSGLQQKPPAMDLQHKELTLSLDARVPGGNLLLDDLKIEIRSPR